MFETLNFDRKIESIVTMVRKQPDKRSPHNEFIESTN